MSTIITGHTSGLGKELLQVFPGAVGISRSNGYDINSIATVVNKVKDYTVFINNAQSKFCQTEILFELWDHWKDKDNIIVCISSNSGDGIKKKKHPYAIYKASLDKACQQLNNSGNRCRVLNIRPGYIDTPSVKHVTANKLETHVLAYHIYTLVQTMKMDNILITEVTLLPR